mgnify:FL=1
METTLALLLLLLLVALTLITLLLRAATSALRVLNQERLLVKIIDDGNNTEHLVILRDNVSLFRLLVDSNSVLKLNLVHVMRQRILAILIYLRVLFRFLLILGLK